MTAWRIELLGGLCATHGRRAVDRFPTHRVGGLLAYLAYHPGPHARDEVVERLWPAAAPAQGRNSLRNALSVLRKALDPQGRAPIEADRARVALAAGVEVDATLLLGGLAAARTTADPAAREAALARAAGLYRGDLLPGYYDDWILDERERLRRAVAVARGDLAALARARGEPARALVEARAALALDPLDEDACAEAMRAALALGRPADALRELEGLEHALARELGVAPGPALHALAAEARRARGRGDLAPLPTLAEASPRAAVAPAVPPAPARADAPSRPATPAGAATHAPAATPPGPSVDRTAFIGRAAELRDVADTLGQGLHRLLTVTGPPGVGKSRLAAEVARALHGERGLAAYIVPCGSISLAPALAEAILATVSEAEVAAARPVGGGPVGAPAAPTSLEGASPLEVVERALRGRPALLVLDDLDGPQAEVRSVVDALLTRARGALVLVTAQRRLDLAGERELPLEPLPQPPAGAALAALAANPAVQLFVDRARARDARLALTDANAAAIAALCRALEGLPLGIELCAGWVDVLRPEALLDRLAAGDDLLRARRGGGGGAEGARHASLAAAVEAALDALPGPLAQALARLSVFAGAFGLDLVEDSGCLAAAAASALPGVGPAPAPASAAGSAPLAPLAALAPPTPSAPLPPLAPLAPMPPLETLAALRERSLLAALEGARFRLLAPIRAAAAQRLPADDARRLRDALATALLARLEAERSAPRGPEHERALAGLAAEHDHLAAALGWCLEGGGDRDLGRRLAIAATPYCLLRGHLAEGRRWLARVLDTPVWTPAQRAPALLDAARLALAATDLDAAIAHLAESVALLRAEGDAQRLGRALRMLAATHSDRGDLAAAGPLLDEALVLARASRSQSHVVSVLRSQGRLALMRGRLAEGRASLEEALALARESTGVDAYGVATVLDALAVVHDLAGDLAAARAHLEQARHVHERLGSERDVAYMVLSEAYLESAPPGDHERLVARTQPLVPVFERLHDPRGAGWARDALGGFALARGDLDQAERLLDQALRTFRRLRLAAGVASALGHLAGVALARRDGSRAAALTEEAVALVQASGERLRLPPLLERMAECALLAGEAERAAALLGAAEGEREAMGFAPPARSRDERGALVRRLVAALGDGPAAAARARGRSLGARVLEDLPGKRDR